MLKSEVVALNEQYPGKFVIHAYYKAWWRSGDYTDYDIIKVTNEPLDCEVEAVNKLLSYTKLNTRDEKLMEQLKESPVNYISGKWHYILVTPKGEYAYFNSIDLKFHMYTPTE